MSSQTGKYRGVRWIYSRHLHASGKPMYFALDSNDHPTGDAFTTITGFQAWVDANPNLSTPRGAAFTCARDGAPFDAGGGE